MTICYYRVSIHFGSQKAKVNLALKYINGEGVDINLE